MKSKNVVLAGLAGFLFLALSASQAAASPAEEAAQAGELSMRRLAQFQAALKPFTPAPFPGGSAAQAAGLKPKDYPCGVAAATKSFEMKAAAANWELSEGSDELTLRLIDFSPQRSSRPDEFKYWIKVAARGVVLDREFKNQPDLGMHEIIARRDLYGLCKVISATRLE